MRKFLTILILISAFVWPTRSDGITTYFGTVVEGIPHLGIDIAAPYGRDVVAAEGGTVTWAGWDTTGFGNRIDIDNGTNRWLYGHLNSIDVSYGQQVATGQHIGAVGCNGWCTGPHLHFGVWWLGQPIDPLVVLPQ